MSYILLKRGLNKLLFLVQNYFHFPITRQETERVAALEPIHITEQDVVVGAPPVEAENVPLALSIAVT